MRRVREDRPSAEGIVLRCPDCDLRLPASRTTVLFDGAQRGVDVVRVEVGIETTGDIDGLPLYQPRLSSGQTRTARHPKLTPANYLAETKGRLRGIAPMEDERQRKAWVDTQISDWVRLGVDSQGRYRSVVDAPIALRCPDCRCVAIVPTLSA